MPENERLSPLVRVDQYNVALTFVNHLAQLDIEAEAVKADAGFLIYCHPENYEQALQEFEQYARQPYHPKYQQSNWQQGQAEAMPAQSGALKEFNQRFLDHAGLITLIVFGLCWFVFMATQLGWGAEIFSQLRFFEQLSIPSLISEPWRLLGPAFFHFSWLHIVFNTMWWWQLGGDIENRLGTKTLLTILIVSALVSNVGQFIVSGANFGGLSGVVYALVGFIWWYGWLAPEQGLNLPKPLIGFMLFWLLLGYTNFSPVNMANTAHLLGLVSGCILARIKIGSR